jgi:DNA polymerase I-like protein with 3'-5' exonuclease and polymerase domains
MPTGRTYYYEPYLKRGELTWPRTQILNYPVQGLGADLMTLARSLLWSSLVSSDKEIKLISTVHDSILVDCPSKDVDFVCEALYNVWNEIPAEFKRLFGVPFNLPMRCEIQVGKDWGNMEDYNAH